MLNKHEDSAIPLPIKPKVLDPQSELELKVDTSLIEEIAFLKKVEKMEDRAHIGRLGLTLTRPFRIWWEKELDWEETPPGALAEAIGITFGNLLASVANMSNDPTKFAKVASDSMMRVFGQRLKPPKVIKPKKPGLITP